MFWKLVTSFLFLIAIYSFKFICIIFYVSELNSCYDCHEIIKTTTNTTYDYIIVGGGTAGSVVARRLSEDKNAKILVLEAGAESNSILKIPSISLMLQNTWYDWQYRTTPQKHACKALQNQSSFWPMGRIIGGTHMLNNMIYLRGHKEDYAEWYKDQENYDYYSDILPYFKKMENSIHNSHLTEGSVIIDEAPYFSQFTKMVLEAARDLDHNVFDDNINCNTGFSKPVVTKYNGQRRTTADQLQIQNRKNVLLRTYTLVEKVLFRKNYEAYAVKYIDQNEHYYARARKGIILSAGVIGTPKILMLSGVGETSHLKEIGITPKINLPVGNNLQDHITTGLDLVLLNTTLDVSIERMLSPRSLYDYLKHNAGPWTMTGCDVLGLFNTNYSKNLKQKPDLQLMVMPLGISSDSGIYLQSLVNINKKVWNEYFYNIKEETAVTFLPIVLHPKSRGVVRLLDKNVNSQPLINPNYLIEKYDLEILLKGINLIKEIIESKHMKKMGVRLNDRHFPGCEMYEFDTKDYWECYVRHLTLTTFHPVGTCKMGAEDNVVDYNFKVKGTNNLFIVDASIIPSLVSGNIMGSIIMLAEKASDVIKYQNYLNTKNCAFQQIFLTGKDICYS